jgi:ABC-2 type transport system permease protein
MKKLNNHRASKTLSIFQAFRAEWKAIIKDKAVLSTFITTALVVMLVYTYVYSKEVIRKVPIAVIDMDQSIDSRNYLQMLETTEEVSLNDNYIDFNLAKAAFYNGDVKGLVLIPKNFSEDIRTSRQTTVSVFADASYMLYYKQIAGALNTVNAYYGAGVDVKKIMSAGNTKNQAMDTHSPVLATSISLYNPSNGYASYLIPIVTSLITQLVILLAIGILGGTRIEHLKLQADYPGVLNFGGTITVLFGKALLYILLYVLILVLQLGIIYTIFNIPIRGSFITLIVFMIPYILSVVFLGVFLSSLFNKREDAIMALIFTTIPFMMLSGLSYPAEGFPVFYQYLAKIIPSNWGISGFVKITQMDAFLIDVIKEWTALWVLSLVYFGLASYFIKSSVKKSLLADSID